MGLCRPTENQAIVYIRSVHSVIGHTLSLKVDGDKKKKVLFYPKRGKIGRWNKKKCNKWLAQNSTLLENVSLNLGNTFHLLRKSTTSLAKIVPQH